MSLICSQRLSISDFGTPVYFHLYSNNLESGANLLNMSNDQMGYKGKWEIISSLWVVISLWKG